MSENVKESDSKTRQFILEPVQDTVNKQRTTTYQTSLKCTWSRKRGCKNVRSVVKKCKNVRHLKAFSLLKTHEIILG